MPRAAIVANPDRPNVGPVLEDLLRGLARCGWEVEVDAVALERLDLDASPLDWNGLEAGLVVT
ncbi:MAG TPA: hypothetical protein VJP59_07865, partial [Gemmatimonadota bacterium]|nr:hypothetical protein [Gemmatimonadota bacterium]